MAARLRRLLPIYLLAIVLSIIANYQGGYPLHPLTILGHLAFLQDAHSAVFPVFQTNGALWSLSFEFYFYLFYALTIGPRQAIYLALWGCAGLVALVASFMGAELGGVAGHFQDILALSPLWLLGATLAGPPLYFRKSLVQNVVLFSFIPFVSRLVISTSTYNPIKNLLLALLAAPLLYSLANRKEKSEPSSPLS